MYPPFHPSLRIMRVITLAVLLLLCGGTLVQVTACAQGATQTSEASPPTGGGANTVAQGGVGGGHTANGGLAGGLSIGGNLSTGGSPPTGIELQGTVMAPNGTVPVSGALVYVTKTTPASIPDQVFCDRCVELDPTTPYVLSGADGSFNLGVPDLGNWVLVVRKGAFRRVRSISVNQLGTFQVPAEHTTFPRASDSVAGDHIPKIAVAATAQGTWDHITDTLGKLGLAELDGYGDLVPGSESFDLYVGGGIGDGPSELLTDYSILSQYHILLFPCALSWPDDYLTNPVVLQNLRQYVAAGGRLYVTDFSYDILRQAFPEPIQWEGDDGSFGSAETSSYDAPATVNDPGLEAWLAAQGVTGFSVQDNWTIVAGVQDYSAPDEDGITSTFSPTVWVSANVPNYGVRPSTVSYQYGCGRVLFSTYHTEPWGLSVLMPQERALLYVILEVAVCLGDFPVPN